MNHNTKNDLKFIYPDDMKALLIGVMATYVSVVLWDIIKYRYKLLNYKDKPND
jgi:hypothetical protein